MEQPGNEQHLLPHTLAIGVHALVRLVSESEQGEQVHALLFNGLTRHAMQFAYETQVLHRGEYFVKGGVLRDVSDASFDFDGIPADIKAEH